ncbi:helix-turn-helix transcriptional regulator [Solimonas soli]|uniref:helix-turn-helix transcriptional regulator n=1 Tax=Solimonas soli TaxID=413479 RepID=UPI000A01CC3C|nr:AlpA family phage regulatory protein [Solimonas soli]
MAEAIRNALAVIRRRQLEARLGLSRSTIYDRLDPKSPRYDPDFPRPIRLGAGSVGWIEGEVERYVQALIERSRGAVA